MKGKKILLGITGSIAAYKAAFLVRLLVKSGAEVQVLMTAAATLFITPLTLSTLSRRPVYTHVSNEDSWNDHVDQGLWADAMVIAPATANTLAKMAAGLCDDMITATYLSARCPVFIAPAMDVDMWHHPATRRNVRQLQEDGVHMLPVEHGELASGLVGEGRMAEPDTILEQLEAFFNQAAPLQGKQILLTAGPTQEAIDPVRFIGNHSSGKMGMALANALAARGARVEFVLGPTALPPPVHPNINTHQVITAQEMFERATALFPQCQAAILAAAVADYRPRNPSPAKMKKKAGDLQLELERTPDIAACLGQQKNDQQILVGFALETDQEYDNARNKLEKKNFDFIVLNSLRDPGAGFRHDTNKVSILFHNNKTLDFELKSKDKVAEDIVTELVKLVDSRQL